MDYGTIEALQDRHPHGGSCAQHAPLVLSFLGSHFVDGNAGVTPATRLVDLLDENLGARNAGAEEARFPRSPEAYLEAWSGPVAASPSPRPAEGPRCATWRQGQERRRLRWAITYVFSLPPGSPSRSAGSGIERISTPRPWSA